MSTVPGSSLSRLSDDEVAQLFRRLDKLPACGRLSTFGPMLIAMPIVTLV